LCTAGSGKKAKATTQDSVINKQPPKKKQPKKNQAKKAPKLPWDKTYEECYEEAKKAVYNHFKPKKLEKKVHINPADSAFFLKMIDANQKKFISPSDYDRSITKSYEKKMKSAGSSARSPKEAIN
jgi:hypothetical protein